MRLIAHRGNLDGPKPSLENDPNYLKTAIDQGFEVELDVWYHRGEFYLGHDGPLHQVPTEFLLAPGRWCHAKNLLAIEMLLMCGAHCFWHENDIVTLTSRGYIWTYPGKPLVANSICVSLDRSIGADFGIAVGVCSDYVESIRGHNDRR